jgi:hypothetical protein
MVNEKFIHLQSFFTENTFLIYFKALVHKKDSSLENHDFLRRLEIPPKKL